MESISGYKPGYTVSGLISGLDVDDMVKKLVEVDAKPLVQLEAAKKQYEAQLGSWREFDGLMLSLLSSANTLALPGGFAQKKITSSDESVITASATPAAAEGTFNINVRQLATTHQLKLVDEVGDYSVTQFGTGTITLEVDGLAVDVAIDSSNNTLQGIVSAINNSGADAVASFAETSSGSYQLILTSRESGLSGQIDVTLSEGIAGLSFTDLQVAQDAKIWIGSDASHIEITRSENSFNDVFPGVTLNLQKPSDPVYAQVRVSTDPEATQASVNAFLTSYNKIIDYLDRQFFYSSESKEQGTLQGNSTLILIQNRLERIVTGSPPVSGAYRNLFQIGITADKSGKLFITDAARFNEALASKPDDLTALFSDGEEGIAIRMKQYIDSVTKAGSGDIMAAEEYAQQQIDSVKKSIDDKNEYLARAEAYYRARFNEMEEALGLLRSQMTSISSSLQGLISNSATT